MRQIIRQLHVQQLKDVSKPIYGIFSNARTPKVLVNIIVARSEVHLPSTTLFDVWLGKRAKKIHTKF